MLCQPKGEKMKKFKHIPLFITSLLSLFNCAPITSDMHSAKTVGKGGIEITLNSGTLDYEDAESSMSEVQDNLGAHVAYGLCLLYTSPSPRDRGWSRMPSSA